MKKSTLLGAVLFGCLLSFPNIAFAEKYPAGDSTIYTKDLSSTNLPATYGAAGNSYATGLVRKSNVCIVNGASTKIYATTSTVANCTGGADKFVVPASGSACFENVKVNSRFCVRSSNGTLSSGVIDVMLW